MKTYTATNLQTTKRKRFPLINLSFNAKILLPEQEMLLKGQQVSHDELRLEANPTQVSQLVPRKDLHRPEKVIVYPCTLAFENFELTTEIQVVRCRRASQTKFEVVFKLPSIEEDQIKNLEQLLTKNISSESLANPFN